MQLFSTRFRVGLLTYQTSFAIWRLLPRYPFIHKNIGTGLRLACQVSASGNIAILTLFDETYRQKALDLAQSIHVIDLARHPDFQEVFMKSLSFPI